VYYYLSGFDPAHARYSPGAALVAFAIRSAIEERATQFDFLRKREEFKYQWGARDRVSRRLLLSPSTAYARDVA
jgi:CelD/BcsL family acetyltransferase involved in cellulose biosynthesis